MASRSGPNAPKKADKKDKTTKVDKTVRDEFRKAIDQLPDLAPRSRVTYASVLRKLADFPEFPGLQQFLRWPADDIMDRLTESYDNMNSMRTATVALGKLLAPLQGKQIHWTPEEIDNWKQLQREKDEVYYEPSPVTWQQLRRAERALRRECMGSRDHLALALFVLFPPRNAYDWSVMTFSPEFPEEGGNVCVVPPNASPCTLRFDRFKTQKSHGDQTYLLTKAPQGFDFKTLSEALRIYSRGGHTHPTDTHAVYEVTRELFGVSVGPSVIRRALLDDIRQNLEDYDDDDLEMIGDCMAFDLIKTL